jgi:hypothetical protein
MLHWYAVYKDTPHEAARTEERPPRARVLRRFGDAAVLGMHDGRAVIGMWLIDAASDQSDVIAINGDVPPEVRSRYEAYIARVTGTN